MGVAGALDDFGDITVNVYQYAPNDYGLYNMAGNVNEWVMDVYRPLSIQDNNEFRPFRGNVYETRRLNAEGRPVDKYDYVVYNIDGVKSFLQVYETEGNKVGAFTPEDVDLMGNLNQKVTDAEERMKAKRFEEAQTLMQDAMDLIVDSDAIAAATFARASAKTSTRCLVKTKCARKVWKKTSTAPTTAWRTTSTTSTAIGTARLTLPPKAPRRTPCKTSVSTTTVAPP